MDDINTVSISIMTVHCAFLNMPHSFCKLRYVKFYCYRTFYWELETFCDLRNKRKATILSRLFKAV